MATNDVVEILELQARRASFEADFDQKFEDWLEQCVEAWRLRDLEAAITRQLGTIVLRPGYEKVKQWVANALESGFRQGFRKSFRDLAAARLITIYRDRSNAIPEDIRATIETMSSLSTLSFWVKLAKSHGTANLTAAIRATVAN
jgi:hypothetical protein